MPKQPLASQISGSDAPEGGGGAQLHCPVCGIMVKLPATECPKCRTNLRTGEKPEEFIPLWKRKKGRLIVLLVIVFLPIISLTVISRVSDNGVLGFLRDAIGLDSCAEPVEMWEEFDQARFEGSVQSGFDNWRKGMLSRLAGSSPYGPESAEEAARDPSVKLLERDRRSYFAATLISRGPSEKLKSDDNWYRTMPGEWDIAYTHMPNTSEERIVAGEWTFNWVNDGQALQDVLSVPYRWQKSEDNEGFVPVQSTTLRAFNHRRGYWEGFRVEGDQLFFFRGSRNAQGQIIEHYQLEGGPLVVTVLSDMGSNSFRAAVSQSFDNGSSYSLVAEIWAKKRTNSAN
jgi:hypothetical protein